MVLDIDPHQDVRRCRLGIGHLDRPITVLVEHARVQQFELRVVEPAPTVLPAQRLVRERRLWVVVAPTQPRMAGQRVEVPPVLLGILAVIALGARQSEDPFLQDGVAAIPQRQRQTQPLTHIRYTGQAVLVPAVGTRPGVIVWERRPCIATFAVILTHRTPGALGEVWTPLIPLARREQIAVRPADRRQPPVLRGTRPCSLRHGPTLLRRPNDRTRSCRTSANDTTPRSRPRCRVCHAVAWGIVSSAP